jgi:hypothetical protein
LVLFVLIVFYVRNLFYSDGGHELWSYYLRVTL